jgi:protein-tyrosine phosphatase
VTLRERSDTFTLDDPKPGVAELGRLIGGPLRGLARRLERRWLQLPFVQRRLRRRATEALRNARTILFACKGNICRSPFASHFIRDALRPGQRCLSGGYYPVAGRRSPETAVAAAARLGVDLAEHRSIRLTEDHVRDADAIFVFDFDNYRRLLAEYDCGRKLHFVGALCPEGPLWIDDPYGEDVDGFLRAYERIRTAITAGLG